MCSAPGSWRRCAAAGAAAAAVVAAAAAAAVAAADVLEDSDIEDTWPCRALKGLIGLFKGLGRHFKV